MKKQKTLLRRVIIILAVLVLLAALALVGIGNFLVSYAIGRGGDGGNRQVSLNVDKDAVSSTQSQRELNAANQKKRNEAFQAAVTPQSVSITSEDGLSLVGGYYAQEGHQWALVIHGYRSRGQHMLSYAERYYSAGFQVLAPDLRGCGESGGDYVGMGWPDRLDILRWIDWILSVDPEAQIVLHGVSMGAATVMMTSGENVPAAVVAYVEDCGYTSVWDIFASELGLRFHLPTFPILNVASGIARLRAGYDFSNASALEQVARCDRPMLFIHGDQDNFVPFSMLQPLYEAKPGEKQQLVVPGAGHGVASTVLGDSYWEAVFDFLAQYGLDQTAPADAAA